MARSWDRRTRAAKSDHLRCVKEGLSLSSCEMLSDEQIVAQIQLGSVSGFGVLVQRHQAKALRVAFRLVRNEFDARDIVQEAFLRVYRRVRRFEGNASFSTWFHRIVYNLAIDMLRRPFRCRLSVEHIEKSGQEVAQLTDLVGLSVHPDEVLGRVEISRKISDALEQLSPIHREVIVLREILGLSYDEMASAMGCVRGTIMSRLFHARQRLQQLLRGLYEEQFSQVSRVVRCDVCGGRQCDAFE